MTHIFYRTDFFSFEKPIASFVPSLAWKKLARGLAPTSETAQLTKEPIVFLRHEYDTGLRRVFLFCYTF